MNTGSVDERQMLHNIAIAADALNRIANCMEADEQRKRRLEEGYLEGECSTSLCTSPVVAMIDHKGYCQDHIEIGFAHVGMAIKAAKAGFQYLEDAVREEGGDGGDHPTGS